MRLTILAIILLGVICPTLGSSAQTTYEFRAAPAVGLRGGDTRFELKFPYLRPDSSLGMGRSELVFPLDYNQVGFEFEFRALQSNRPVWRAGLRFALSAGDPKSDMTDQDWINPGFGMLEFSSTNSTVDGSMAMLGVDVSRLLTASGRWELAGCLGFEYQLIKQRMVDLRGWQYDITQVMQLEEPVQVDSLTRHVFDVEILAGTYEVRYFRPQIGLMPRLVVGSCSIGLKAVISPLLQVRDIDDHVLRGFQIRTSGRGFGYSGCLKIDYVARRDRSAGLFCSLIGEFARASADVSGFREFYADSENDPDDPDDDIPAGTVWLGEIHHVTSTQYGLHFAVGLRF